MGDNFAPSKQNKLDLTKFIYSKNALDFCATILFDEKKRILK